MEKSKYKSLNEWKLANDAGYQSALRNGMIRCICDKFGWKYRVLSVTKQTVLKLAKSYNGTNFADDYTSEYGHARRNNYISKLKGVLKMQERSSKELCLKTAKEYTGNNFQRDFPGLYVHSRKNNYFDELKKALKTKEKTKQSKERTLKLAKSYKGTNFRKDFSNEYQHANKKKYIPELRQILNAGKI